MFVVRQRGDGGVVGVGLGLCHTIAQVQEVAVVVPRGGEEGPLVLTKMNDSKSDHEDDERDDGGDASHFADVDGHDVELHFQHRSAVLVFRLNNEQCVVLIRFSSELGQQIDLDLIAGFTFFHRLCQALVFTKLDLDRLRVGVAFQELGQFCGRHLAFGLAVGVVKFLKAHNLGAMGSISNPGLHGLERGGSFDVRVNAATRRVLADRNHDSATVTIHNLSAGEAHRVVDVLLLVFGFTSQARFIDLHAAAIDEQAVSGNDVANFEHDDVANDEIKHRDCDGFVLFRVGNEAAVTPHLDIVCFCLILHVLVHVVLLVINAGTKESNEHYGCQNCDTFDPFAGRLQSIRVRLSVTPSTEGDRDQCSHEKHNHGEVLQLLAEKLTERRELLRWDCILAVHRPSMLRR
mmetsp:Transcript_8369/g.12166  ORF Transcript_8369/g.12166 Transcript_8369/m.12166 type:complete len:405 (-) Transcript_8369:280-1494(-)